MDPGPSTSKSIKEQADQSSPTKVTHFLPNLSQRRNNDDAVATRFLVYECQDHHGEALQRGTLLHAQ